MLPPKFPGAAFQMTSPRSGATAIRPIIGSSSTVTGSLPLAGSSRVPGVRLEVQHPLETAGGHRLVEHGRLGRHGERREPGRGSRKRPVLVEFQPHHPDRERVPALAPLDIDGPDLTREVPLLLGHEGRAHGLADQRVPGRDPQHRLPDAEALVAPLRDESVGLSLGRGQAGSEQEQGKDGGSAGTADRERDVGTHRGRFYERGAVGRSRQRASENGWIRQKWAR